MFKYSARILACLTVFFLSGCTQMGVPNPFATVSDVKDVYYEQFTDIPVPVDMKSVPAATLVTPSQDGNKVGLETFEGRVEAASLANAMIHNMARQGWSLRGSISGKNTMQLHEKEQRFAVICIRSQTLDTAMEVWVLNRLSSGSFGNIPASGYSGSSGALFSPTPSGDSSSAVVSQQLSQ